MNYTIAKKDSLFEDLFLSFFDYFPTKIEKSYFRDFPKSNVTEDENEYKINLFYPGVKKENFKISIEDRILKISCNVSENKESSKEKWISREYYYEGFNRSFKIPEEVEKDKIKAEYESGVLNILIPKDKEKEKQRKIEISIN